MNCPQCDWPNDPFNGLGQCLHVLPEPERPKIFCWKSTNAYGIRYFEVPPGWRMLEDGEKVEKSDIEAPNRSFPCGINLNGFGPSWGATESQAVFLNLDALSPSHLYSSHFKPADHWPIWRRC